VPQPCKDEEQLRFDAQSPDNVGGASKSDTGKAEDTGAPIKNEAGDDSIVSLSPKPIASRSLGVTLIFGENLQVIIFVPDLAAHKVVMMPLHDLANTCSLTWKM
jgi:hypothetical protein